MSEARPITVSSRLADLAARVAGFAGEASPGPEHATDIEGLLAIHSRRPTAIEPVLYQPSFCIILRGGKCVQLGDRRLDFGPGDAVVISHHLPVLAKITVASEHEPFSSLAFDLDLGLARELHDRVGEPTSSRSLSRSLETGPAPPALVDAMVRLFDLVGRRRDGEILAPLLRREIHYRLLSAPQGETLRQLLQESSHASQIARAISLLRRDFSQPLAVPDLARAAGMSDSSFHEHFRSLTGTTPLQYLKSLRLLEARRLIREGKHNVTEAALGVGYQSPTQFSREYSRHFGHSPRHDLTSA
ncbi:MAG: AraC family transcriptional regulator [Acidobacteriota bacterium]